jgi:hypothetical protein
MRLILFLLSVLSLQAFSQQAALNITTYTYTSIVNGCISDNLTNRPIQLPNANIAVSNLSLCNGGAYKLSVLQNGGTYTWSTGATEPVITVASSGVYSVTVTDSLGFSAYSEVYVDLSILETPITMEGNMTKPGDKIIIDAIPGFSYQWSNGEVTPFITVTKPDLYYVIITDEENCSITSNPLIVAPRSIDTAINLNDNKDNYSAAALPIIEGKPVVKQLNSN